MAEQMTIPGMPSPSFNARSYTEAALARAQRKVDEARELVESHPDLLEQAARMARDEAAQRGHVGVRYLGELVRRWLADGGEECGLRNNSIAVLVRWVCEDEPWLRGYFNLQPCAIDAVLAGGAA